MASKFRSSSDELNEKFGSPKLASNRNLSTNQQDTQKVNKNLSECCYSIGNLALIISSVVALVVLVKFIQDDPLYDYGEHLLSLNFYRELIYIIVVIPLVLLIPIFNAASVFFLSNDHKHESTKSILNVRLFYQLLMLIMVFIGLIFIAPSIRATTLSSRIELELRKHMKFRYENSFSYEFLDRLQEQYQCCDELWYRANMHDNLPTSCFVPDGTYTLIYDETCAESIGTLVSTRCCFIAGSLFVIIIALVCLIAVDIRELLRPKSRGQYEVTLQDNDTATNYTAIQHQTRAPASDGPRNDRNATVSNNQSINPTQRRGSDEGLDDLADVHLTMTDDDSDSRDSPPRHPANSSGQQYTSVRRDKINRLNADERRRESPLIRPQQLNQFDDDYSDEQAEQFDPPAEDLADNLRPKSPTILTRANYNLIKRERSQSPVFLGQTVLDKRPLVPPHRQQQQQQPQPQPIAGPSSSSTARPPQSQATIKSALKKSSSQQKMNGSASSPDNHQDDANYHDRAAHDSVSMSANLEDEESLDDYASRLRSNSFIRQQREREQQAKRSLLSVRFAD